MADLKLKPKVILVADRTLSANYATLFDGMFATMQTTEVPSVLMKHFVSPPVPVDYQARAAYAPIGLRRIQSALVKYTCLEEKDIVCTTPEALPELLGPWVEIVAVSSSDPLGYGMSNTTTSSFCKGELYTRLFTRQLLATIGKAKEKFNFTVIGGGAGAWQWRTIADDTASATLDVIFEGYFESVGPQLFEDILAAKEVHRHIGCNDTAIDEIQPIRRASIFGAVELSRGCGRGCCFCSMSRKKMEHVPIDTILADIETNLAAGITSVVNTSEDFFRYGADGLKPDFDKLFSLLSRMRSLRGLDFMQIDHINITSAAQLTDEQLRQVRELLTWNKPHKYLWVNLGVESASGSLVAANCYGKVAPYLAEDWQELVCRTVTRLISTGFTPILSLVLGLPGETPDDVLKTQKLVEFLGKKDIVVFPIFYEPYEQDTAGRGTRFTIDDMRPEHLNLFRSCYELNFRMVPKLIWDNQSAAGVNLMKRIAMQMLGKLEIAKWRLAFKRTEKALMNQPGTDRRLRYAS